MHVHGGVAKGGSRAEKMASHGQVHSTQDCALWPVPAQRKSRVQI